MNLQTYLICFVLVAWTAGMQAMKKAPSLTPAQTGRIVQLKESIRNHQKKAVENILDKIDIPLPHDILFSLNGDTPDDREIFDLILAYVGDSKMTFVHFQNPNLKNQTLAHIAAERGWVDMLHKLVVLGANITSLATDGKTPLARAVERYCLLCRSKHRDAIEKAEQTITFFQHIILISMQDYQRDVQTQTIQIFKLESSDKSDKPLLPDFLTMEAFKLKPRNFAPTPALPAISSVQGQPQPNNDINQGGNGQHPTPALQPQIIQTPSQSIAPREPVASSSNTNMPIQQPLTLNNPISTPIHAPQTQGQQSNDLQELRMLNGLKTAISNRLLDEVKGILERSPHIVLPENIFNIQINPTGDIHGTAIVQRLIEHIVKNDRPLEPYIKHVVENQYLGTLDVLLESKVVATIDVLQIAVQSLTRNAQLNQSQANTIKILRKLTEARTLSVNEKEKIQAILAPHFYWGGNNGQPGKHQLPEVCVSMVSNPTHNLIGQNPAIEPVVPNHNQLNNNSASSMFTSQNKYILAFGVCALFVYGTYVWLYQDEIEDDTQPRDEDIAQIEERK